MGRLKTTSVPARSGPLPDAVFVNPAFAYPIIKDRGVFYTKKWPPLSLAYGAAIMEQRGRRVAVVDAHAERLGPARVAEAVRCVPEVFISTSPLDRWQCPVSRITNVYDVIEAVRAASPCSRIILTGPHGTTLPEKILSETPADAVILGEPESTVRELAAGRRLEEIDGVAYREAATVVVKRRKKYMDLDDLPLPAFHLLPMDKYYFDFLGRRFTVLEGSRGCPFHCTFCYKDMYGPYRTKSAARLVEEVAFAHDRFGVRNFYFADLTFTVDRALVLETCDGILARGLKVRWACQTRLDRIDGELLERMRDAGCCLIEVGVESGTEAIVRGTNKYIPPKTITDGIRKIRGLGMESVAFMLLGLPGETREDMRRSIRLARRIAPTYVAFNAVVPYTEACNRDLFEPPAERAVFFPARWNDHSEKALDGMMRRAWISFYARPQAALTLLKHPQSALHKISLLFAVARTNRAG
jgi:anaerobic magnesium-protoporphyrin IX monomethyl ester cyclase